MTKRAHDILVIKTCHSLATAGHEVYLVVGKTHASMKELLQFYGLASHPNLHVIQIPILRRSKFPKVSWHFIFNVFCLKEILLLKKSLRPDLIYLSEIKLAEFLLKFKRIIDVPFVYEVHGLYAKEYRIPHERERNVFSSSDIIITTLLELKKKILEIYKVTCPVIKVPLAASPLSRAVQQESTSKGKKKVFYIGQLYPLQGVEVLINAMSHLPEWVELHLVGGKREEIERLSSLTELLKVKDHIVFHGFIPHGALPALMGQADVMAIPSLSKGKMPYVAHTKIYEYMAAGTPIVAADMPSVREEIEDGSNGILVAPEDPHALAEGIMRVLNNPDLASELSRKALDKSREYTWQKRAERLIAAFRKVHYRDTEMVA